MQVISSASDSLFSWVKHLPFIVQNVFTAISSSAVHLFKAVKLQFNYTSDQARYVKLNDVKCCEESEQQKCSGAQ